MPRKSKQQPHVVHLADGRTQMDVYQYLNHLEYESRIRWDHILNEKGEELGNTTWLNENDVVILSK